MRLIEKTNIYFRRQNINFHGVRVDVPDWACYLAAEPNGDVLAFTLEPRIDEDDLGIGWIRQAGTTIVKVAMVDLEGFDFTKTLIAI